MVEFKPDKAGMEEFLKSKEMAAALETHGRKVLNRLPKGYGMTVGETSQRAKVTVGTRSSKAAADNLKNNTLLKALGGG